MNTKEATCEDRINDRLESRLDDLRLLWKLYCEDPEAYDDDHGRLDDYGLCFDYVAPETFKDQPKGYFRYQISYGGPSSEFRIFANKRDAHTWTIYRIDFHFLDWFDGARRTLRGDDLTFMEELITSYFVEAGSFDHAHNESLAA